MSAACPKIVAVVVTRDRPALLARCLAAIAEQSRPLDAVLVIDNGSRLPVGPALARLPRAEPIRRDGHDGPAAAFRTGIRVALARRADFVWLMDDDGRPADAACLATLLATAVAERADLVSPLVCDVDCPTRLAFPIRQRRRTRFTRAELEPERLITGFAHLFNGALMSAALFGKVGMPNPRLFMRGDEVDFLLRIRRKRLRVLTDTQAAFWHPSSHAEIHPILGGRFYVTLPDDPVKRYCQFRNRGWIFTRHRRVHWLMADHVRYACHFLGTGRDMAGYLGWLHATWRGVLGQLGPPASRGSPAGRLPHGAPAERARMSRAA